MAVRHGYGKVATNGLVFAYDTGDTRNSYRGEPTTNLLTGASDMVSNGLVDLGANMEYQGRIEDGINVNGTNYPSFRYKSLAPSNSYVRILNISVTANTQYTFSIYGKMSVGTSTQNVGALYSTDYNGTMSPSTGLTSDWQKIYYTFTTGASSTNLVLVFFGYDNATNNVVEYALPHLEAKSHPTQFVDGTRSATQGLKDLTGNNTIDLTNVSFDSSAQIEFDGTDDVITTSFSATTISNVTIEAVVYRNQTTGRYEAIIQNNTASDDALYVYPNGRLGFWPHGASSLIVPTGQYSYVAASYDGTAITYCVNGEFHTNSGTSGDITDWDFLRIGGHSTSDSERWIGDIPVAKVYNRALTADEVRNNFRLYKTRFGI